MIIYNYHYKNMKISIICPLYNAEKYIENLHKSLLKQKCDDDIQIKYILTESKDNTELHLKELNAEYYKIKTDEFSHSLTRERAAMRENSDIIVFITQDVIIKDYMWLTNLVTPIKNKEAQACYSRQLCDNNSIEKYTREKNYPNESFTVNKNDINRLGLRTFFFSDAAGAIDLNIFKKLNGYDNKNLPISEDMYFAYKLIMAGYSIRYCANSCVIHSHKFKYKELYKRYYLTGKFFKQNPYLNEFGTNQTGLKMAIYIFKRIIQDKNGTALKEFFPNMIARYLGMKIGKQKGEKYE